MAEPLAIVGAIAAVSQLTDELVKLTTNLRHHLKVMRRAPHEVQCFLMETSNFTCLLNSFTELADRPVQNMEKREQRKREKMVSEVEQQCAYVRDKMEYLVDRFAVLAKENMTPLEGLLERIKYLLDKPDIKDLRLSLQLAALTVNCLSTLFAWEEAAMKDETRTASLLEQLKNLLPMAKKASTELAEYQRKHGTTYESGVPDPNNAMLAASEEIQRQIAHAIRPHSHPGAAKDRSSGERRRERRRKSQSPVVERTSHTESWSSPFGPNGVVADSVEHLPRRNRVSFKTSADHAGDRHSSDHSIGARHDGDIALAAKSRESRLPPAKPPSPVTNGASYVSKQDLEGTSSDKGKQPQANESAYENNDIEAHYTLRPKPSRESYEYDISDQANPRTHKCNRRCTYVHCPLCSELHCSHEQCPPTSQTNQTNQHEQPISKENTTLPNSPPLHTHTINIIPPGISPLPSEPQTARNSVGSLTHLPFPPGEQTHYTLPAPTESEDSGVSDKEIEPRWSRTNLPLPSSSKSSSPSTRSQGGHGRRRSSAAAAPPMGNRLRENQDATGKKPQMQVQQQVQSQYQGEGVGEGEGEGEGEQRGGLSHETLRRRRQRQRLDGLDQRPVGEQHQQKQHQQRHPLDHRAGPRTSASSGEEQRPGPHAPETPPSRGPSGRRRPRRPRPTTTMVLL